MTSPDAAAAPGPSPALEWTRHPLAEERRSKSLALVAVLAGLTVAVAVSFGHVLYGALTFAVLAGSVSRYLLPTRYRVDDGGVAVAHFGLTRHLPWGRFARAEARGDGVYLGAFAAPSRLEVYRGLFLPRPARSPGATAAPADRDGLLRFARQRLGRQRLGVDSPGS